MELVSEAEAKETISSFSLAAILNVYFLSLDYNPNKSSEDLIAQFVRL